MPSQTPPPMASSYFPPHCSTLHFSTTCPRGLAPPCRTANLANGLASSSSYFRICTSLSTTPLGSVILCSRPVPPSALLITRRTNFYCSTSFLFSSSFFISYGQLLHLSTVSSHPGWSHACLQPAASSWLTHQLLFALILPFALIFLVISAMTFILGCCLISSFSVWLSCTPCFLCKSYSLNHEKILAQQSTPFFDAGLFDSLAHPPFRRLTSSFVCSSLADLHFALLPALLPQKFRQLFHLLWGTISSVSLNSCLLSFSSIFLFGPALHLTLRLIALWGFISSVTIGAKR